MREETELQKRTSTLSVILEVITVDVHLVKQLHCNRIIASLRKVDRVPKVASAEVQADTHVLRTRRKGVVVEPDVRVEESIRVVVVFPQSFEHIDVAKVGKERVIDLNIAAAGGVQDLEFLSVCSGDVIEVGFAVRVYLGLERIIPCQ